MLIRMFRNLQAQYGQRAWVCYGPYSRISLWVDRMFVSGAGCGFSSKPYAGYLAIHFRRIVKMVRSRLHT